LDPLIEVAYGRRELMDWIDAFLSMHHVRFVTEVCDGDVCESLQLGLGNDYKQQQSGSWSLPGAAATSSLWNSGFMTNGTIMLASGAIQEARSGLDPLGAAGTLALGVVAEKLLCGIARSIFSFFGTSGWASQQNQQSAEHREHSFNPKSL
jgi:hypothetical protein